MQFRLSLLVVAGLFAAAGPAQKVLFIGRDPTPTRHADPAIMQYLQTRFGAANVTWMNSRPRGHIQFDHLGWDVVVLSSTASSSRYRSYLHNSPCPMVNCEEAVADNGGGEFSITTVTKDKETNHKIKIRTAHPITAGFPMGSTVQIDTGVDMELWWSTGTQAAGATSLAEDDDTPANGFITIVDAGGTLINGKKAECRRVIWGMTDKSFATFTADGKKLFGNAVAWAAGNSSCAGSANYGKGLAGTGGVVPTLTSDAPPVFSSAVTLMGSNSSGVPTGGLVIIGTPFDIRQGNQIAFLGGELWVNPLVFVFMPFSAGGFSFPLTVPSARPAGPGNHFYLQTLQLDAGATNGVAFSPGMRLSYGN